MTDTQPKKWYQKSWGIIFWLIFFFPVGLFLMWKHAGWNKVVKGIVTAIFVLLVIAINSGDSNTSSVATSDNSVTDVTQPVENDKPAPTKKPEPTESIYSVGDSIQGKNLEVSITNTDERESVGTQYIKEEASDGGILIAVDFQYKNTSDKPLKSYNKPEIKLVDANGTEYNSDLGKTSTYATEVKLDRKVWSDLNPGIQVKDADVFEVGKESWDSGEWFIQVKLDGKKYKVAVN